ncbi:MAG: amidohydrolase, partial [Oscillospiraceae bacterium]|nr:amidohydrolase [Oscillospiraceae bacterium]
MTNFELAKKYEEYTIATRNYLHEHPELSNQEYETIKFIMAELEKMGVEYVEIPEGGVLATIRGTEDNGKSVMLRADCDALPVLEKENLNCTRKVWSKNPGVMHACGHDAHTAMLLGAAKVLSEKRDEIKGTIYLIFERGEEGTGNVRYIIPYCEKHGIRPDSIFGTHVSALDPTGTIIINDTDVLASAMGFTIEIEGLGGHGSRPDQSNSPIDCFVAIYHRLEALRLTKVNPFRTCTYSIGSLHAGERGNVIPQRITFSGTMRTFDPEGVGAAFYDAFKKTVDGMCETYDCKPKYIKFAKPGLATVNDIEYSKFAQLAVAEDIGDGKVIQAEPWMGSESFSNYLKVWPG